VAGLAAPWQAALAAEPHLQHESYLALHPLGELSVVEAHPPLLLRLLGGAPTQDGQQRGLQQGVGRVWEEGSVGEQGWAAVGAKQQRRWLVEGTDKGRGGGGESRLWRGGGGADRGWRMQAPTCRQARRHKGSASQRTLPPPEGPISASISPGWQEPLMSNRTCGSG
jgi:hypothetical protein